MGRPDPHTTDRSQSLVLLPNGTGVATVEKETAAAAPSKANKKNETLGSWAKYQNKLLLFCHWLYTTKETCKTGVFTHSQAEPHTRIADFSSIPIYIYIYIVYLPLAAFRLQGSKSCFDAAAQYYVQGSNKGKFEAEEEQ